MADDLWPNDFGDVNKRTPVGILREQARALGEKTSNIVYGRVQTLPGVDGRIRHVFSLWCGPLGYSTNVLHIDHDIDLYPVEISVDDEPGRSSVAGTEVDFLRSLKELFSRERTKKTIASLIAQSKQ